MITTIACLIQSESLVFAQAPGDSLAVILKKARAGNWFIRIETTTGAVEGRSQFVRDSSVRVSGSNISFDDMRRVERRLKHGGGAKTGAVGGALIVGGFFWGLSGLCSNDCGGVRIAAAVFGGVVGGVIGGLAGAVMSPAKTQWETIWVPH